MKEKSTIVLVDDERGILTSLCMALEAEGYKVRIYNDGVEALAGLTEEPADLGVFDIKMPRMDGMELLRRVRQMSDMPVIFLTSKDEEIDEALGLAMGADDTEVASGSPQSLDLMLERSDRGNPLAPLMAAGDEARAAAAWGIGSLALTGPSASEAALKREARGGFTVLHAAAHALTSDQALGANYLILRPDGTDDGYVSGGELSSLSRGMSMVVLSGCRTTGDFGSHGDAVDGLVAPLLARGVRTVIASHWAVSDRWTKVLMERFYERLASGASTADAMNGAQTSLRRAGVPPRFWAAFSVIGDGSLTFTPTTMSRAR